ncbi:MAG: ATP-binding protein [Pseudomonadota bacterium]
MNKLRAGVTEVNDLQLWNALPNPSAVLDAKGRILALNAAGEAFLRTSERQLKGESMLTLVGETSRAAWLIRQVLEKDTSMSDYEVPLTLPEIPARLVDILCAPVAVSGTGQDAALVVVLHPRAIAETLDRSLTHRDAARSITGMAAMLAHEVKNPLAGISGAAQLLEMSLGPRDKELTELIRAEADRISSLLSKVESFGALGPVRVSPVNIHDVIDRAVKSAKAGFASHVRFIEEYDPSLPPVMGDADQLIQVFINLLKNAAEASPEVGGLITARTGYRSGVKVMTATGKRASLPLQVTIADNGRGVPEDLVDHIFEPFVTSKATGTGLGLAFVSKVVAEHGGVISCESEPGWTRIKLRLPLASARDIADADARESAEGDQAAVPGDAADIDVGAEEDAP